MKKMIINRGLQHINKIGSHSEFYNLFCLESPIMFARSFQDSLYLFYVLQDRYVKRKGKKAKVLEVLISRTTYKNIEDVLKGEISIYDALDSGIDKVRIGQIGSRVFPQVSVGNIVEVADKIPNKSCFLDSSLPNYVNLEFQLKRIQERKNFLSQFSYTDFDYDQTLKIDVPVFTLKKDDFEYHRFDSVQMKGICSVKK